MKIERLMVRQCRFVVFLGIFFVMRSAVGICDDHWGHKALVFSDNITNSYDNQAKFWDDTLDRATEGALGFEKETITFSSNINNFYNARERLIDSALDRSTDNVLAVERSDIDGDGITDLYDESVFDPQKDIYDLGENDSFTEDPCHEE